MTFGLVVLGIELDHRDGVLRAVADIEALAAGIESQRVWLRAKKIAPASDASRFSPRPDPSVVSMTLSVSLPVLVTTT